MFAPSWSEVEATPGKQDGHWLAIAEDAEQWKEVLANPNIRFLSYAACADVNALVTELSKPDTAGAMFFAPRMSRPLTPPDNKIALPFLNLLKAAAGTPALAKLRVLAFTMDSQKVNYDDAVLGYAQAMVWGMGRVAFCEYPDFDLRWWISTALLTPRKFLPRWNARVMNLRLRFAPAALRLSPESPKAEIRVSGRGET